MLAACLLCVAVQNSKGERIYADMVDRLSKVTAISGVKTVHFANETARISFVIARPDLFRLQSGDSLTLGKASEIVIYDSKKNESMTQHLEPGVKSFPVVGLESLFTSNAVYYKVDASAEAVLIDGQKVWELVVHPKDHPDMSLKLFVDQSTLLPRGSRVPGPQGSVLEWLSEIKCDPVIEPSTFTLAPPEGVHVVSENPSAEKLLPVGSFAPDFALKSTDGATFTLASVASTHKATVISFWFYGCMACRQEVPDIVKTYNELKSQGLAVLGVDVADPMYRVQAFKNELHVTYPLLVDGAATAEAFGVVGCPTTYVIDKNRKVVATIVGGRDIEKLKKALESLGLNSALRTKRNA